MNENDLMGSMKVSKAVAKMAIPSVISSLVTVVYNTKRDQQSGHGCLQYGRHLFCWTDWGSTAGSSGQSDQSDIYFTDGICKYVWYGWKCRCIYGDGRKK